ncbi:hypothetical protein Btru_051866 [Bulinus truncatus]|nr:hypothetical protein Btru_051866 [Bulinus truncatus]
MADPMASNDLPSMHYEQLSDQEIDDKINENFTYIVENLKVNELLHGRHNFDKIIPDTVLSELRIFDPNRKLRQAKLFLTEYLKSKDKGKGQVFKNALLNSDNKTVRDVFSSNTTELDQAAHSNEGYALDNFRSVILDQLECDVHLVETCYSRRLINDTEKQEIEAGRDHHGSWYGITKLLDCVKKTHHGYSTFLDVLYDIGQRVLMRDLDAEKYDKRKAKDQDGGNEQCHYTEFNESPALSLELHQGNSRPAESVKSLHQLNIPLENNLGDGPVSSRTRSKTKLQETASEGSGEFLVTATIAVQRKKSGKPVDVVPSSLSVPKASTEPDSTSDEENSREKRTIGFHSPGTLKYLPHDKTRKNVTSQKTINDVIKPPKQDHDSASQTEAIRKSFKFFEDSDKNSNMSREIREINKALKAVNIQDITGCRSSPSVTEEMTHRQADNFSSAIGGTSHTKSHGKCSESFTEIEPLKSYSTNRMMEDTEPKQTEKRRFGFQSRNTLKFSNSSKI